MIFWTRAARLAASAMAGTSLKGGKGMSPLEPVVPDSGRYNFLLFLSFPFQGGGVLERDPAPEKIRDIIRLSVLRIDPLLGAAIAALTN